MVNSSDIGDGNSVIALWNCEIIVTQNIPYSK